MARLVEGESQVRHSGAEIFDDFLLPGGFRFEVIDEAVVSLETLLDFGEDVLNGSRLGVSVSIQGKRRVVRVDSGFKHVQGRVDIRGVLKDVINSRVVLENLASFVHVLKLLSAKSFSELIPVFLSFVEIKSGSDKRTVCFIIELSQLMS